MEFWPVASGLASRLKCSAHDELRNLVRHLFGGNMTDAAEHADVGVLKTPGVKRGNAMRDETVQLTESNDHP